MEKRTYLRRTCLRRKGALFLCAVVSSSVLWGCGQAETEETAEDVAVVEASAPEVGSLKLTGSFIATIDPDESVYVIPKATAEVLEVRVEAGDIVNEGDVLAVLDDTIAQFNMKSAALGAQNAELGLTNAQILMDNAQIAYDLQYGEGATTLNDMKSYNTLNQAEDGVQKLQESYMDATDALQRAKDQLQDEEEELDSLKDKYDFREDVEEIKDYADSIDKSTLEGQAKYKAAMERYQAAAAKVQVSETKISTLKSTIDQLEGNIEDLQDNINSTYDAYSQAVTADAIQNGEMRQGQEKTAQNSLEQAQQGLTQAQYGITQAQIAVEQAQENLDAYTITASISGVVETVNIKEHDFATSSNPAFVLSDKDVMVATYHVSEDVRNTFSIGQKIELEKDGKMYDGEVVEIGSAVDMSTGLFKIKAAVKGDVSGLLSGTKATVITDTYHEDNAVIVPYDAVYYEGTQAYVYTVVDGKAKKTYVTTGLYDVERIAVTQGLTSEDIVITTWSAQLRDGVDVSVRGADGNGTPQDNAEE